MELFHRRMTESSARNMVVFSHYPTDYFSSEKEFLATLSNNSMHHVEYFAGHRHSVDQSSTLSTKPNNNWVVGGGGGWGCEDNWYMYPPRQGFLVGKISEEGVLTMSDVLVDHMICCPDVKAPADSPKYVY